MTRVARRFLLLVVAMMSLLAPLPARADRLDPKGVPDALKPWVGWALDGRSTCAIFEGKADLTRCAWPSRLDLVLDDKGGKFTQRWRVDAPRLAVPLPGDGKRWPEGVQVGATRAIVFERNGPHVELARGDATLTGTFTWDSLPGSLKVPQETGLLSLTVRGQAIAAPNRDASGTVWLQKARAAGEEGDRLELVVHRKVTDDIPLTLVTRVEMHVSGKNRELVTGRALPPGFVPTSLESPIPARLEPDGRLRVQARPGVFTLQLAARSDGPVNALSRPPPDGPWREGEEVWVFEARPDLRVVTVAGVVSIDPQQTTLPDAWKTLPAYPMKVQDTLQLVETRRGDAEPPPNQLTLDRRLWLDFDGRGYTARDTLTGTLNRDTRIDMSAPSVLGRVAIGGKDQFITHTQDPGKTGVEVRHGQIVVEADSRIPGGPDLPAVGWAHDFHQVSGTLHLPPGWRLLHAIGVDDASGTWLKHWSLLEIFLALVLAAAIGRLYGPRWGGVAVVLLALTVPEEGAPKWAWIPLLVSEALFRLVPEGWRLKTVFSVTRFASAILVALIALGFVVEHVREGIYPALANPNVAIGEGADVGGRFEATTGEERAPMEKSAPRPAHPKAQNTLDTIDAPTDQENAKRSPDQGAEKRGEHEQDATEALKDERARNREPASPPAVASAWGKKHGSLATRGYMQSNAQVYDPAAIVQTGPGLPRWSWTSLDLRWSGPVQAAQRMRLLLLSPRANLVLAIVRAVLLLFVVLRVLPFIARRLPGGWGSPGGPTPASHTVAASILLFGGLALSPHEARADKPDPKVLDDLSERLLRKPPCAPHCASSSHMTLETRGNDLRVRMAVDAAAETAVPLPGSLAQWTPREVLLDGHPAKGLVRVDGAVLWLLVPEGNHEVTLDGAFPDRETVQLPLPLRPHRVLADLQDWTVEGIHEDDLADENVQCTRIRAEGGKAAALQPGVLPPFVRVERTLQVGLDWQVDTRVIRTTPTGAAVVLEIPLLPGENVTTADVRVVGGKALVNMGPQVTEAAWHSVLEQRSPVRLFASRQTAWTEVWQVDVGPIWHASFGGIPPVRTQPTANVRVPTFRPWPGEEVLVALDRPAGVAGQTSTIDNSTLAVRPGLRATDVTLTVAMRSSRGGEHAITLPPGATLESLAVDGRTQPLRQEGARVLVPLVPGAQTLALTWREPAGIAPLFRVSPVDLGAPSVNATTRLEVPRGRWLLFAGGLDVGPVVLFWSLLAILGVVAVVLGRVRTTPLGWYDWLLLAIGLSQIPIVLGAVVVGWLLALGHRRTRANADTMRPWVFDLRQMGLVLLTAIALAILAAAIHEGLLGAPEMQVKGNGSTASSLVWFSDRSAATLTTPWVVSVPLLVYRAAMLAWALWIALALLGWLRWGWSAFGTGGLWKRSPPRPPPMPAGASAPQPGGPPAPAPAPTAPA